MTVFFMTVFACLLCGVFAREATFGKEAKGVSCKSVISRFAVNFRAIGAFYTSAVSDDLIPSIYRTDLRGNFFRIEGLSRLYERHDEKPFGKIKRQSKAAEDLIGATKEDQEALDGATRWKAPRKILRDLTQKRDESKVKLIEGLQSNFFLHWNSLQASEPRVSRWAQKIQEFEFGDEKKDRKVFLKALVAEAKILENADFDMHLLEEGIHEMKREIRWLLIYFQAAAGLVKLIDSDAPGQAGLNEYRYLVNTPLASGPFSKLPEDASITDPILLPRYLFLALSKIVDELDAVKKDGETFEAIQNSYRDLGYSKEKSHKLAVNVATKANVNIDFYGRAQTIKDEVARTGLFKAVRKALQANE